MEPAYLNTWLNDLEIHAICWTLIHSLWIGLVFALLAAVVIACTRRTTGNFRYRLFCGLLLSFALVMTGVCLAEFSESRPELASNLPILSLRWTTINQNTSFGSPGVSFPNELVDFLNQNAIWIFTLWSACFIFNSLKLMAGILYVQRIRIHRAQSVRKRWKTKTDEFRQRMGIQKHVSIIQSALVKIPVTIGYFKPVIVLPIGLICQLPPGQVETILWHELAHIYRQDYLVNVLQRMVEAVFFFNPPILWLSAIIREEREACCDEIVWKNTRHKTDYLQALAAFHTRENGISGLTMALTGQPHQLISRMKRMVNRENRHLSIPELALVFTGLLIFTAFAWAPQAELKIKNSTMPKTNTVSETLSSILPEKLQQVKPIAKRNINRVPVQAVPQDIVVADTLVQFKSVRFKNSNKDRNNCELNVIDGQDNEYHLIVANGQLVLAEFNGNVVPQSEHQPYKNLLAQIDQLIEQKLKRVAVKEDDGNKQGQ